MTTLVVATTRYGSTREIAERIAGVLRSAKGVNAVVEDPHAAQKLLDSAEAVIVVGPVYQNAWHKPADAFVAGNRAELERKSLFLVASGAGPSIPDDVAARLEALGGREVAYLRGALFKHKLSWWEKLQTKLVGGAYGDFRNWDEVEAFAKHAANRGAV